MSAFGPRTTQVPQVFTHMPHFQRTVDWIQSRIEMLKDTIKSDTDELAMWEEQLSKMPVCKSCNGHGKFIEHVEQDHCVYHKCETCGGTGVNPA